MRKSLVTIAAAAAVLSLGALAADRAQAGSSTSAPTKVNRATVTASVVPTGRRVRATTFGITEVSSSSARNHPPGR